MNPTGQPSQRMDRSLQRQGDYAVELPVCRTSDRSRATGQKLNWDSAHLKFTNSDAANAPINPPYRKGWNR
jgi:hypothetical protein